MRKLRAACDDLTLRGPAQIAWEVLAVLKRDAKAQLGLDLQEIKTEYHAPTYRSGGQCSSRCEERQ